MSLGAAKDSRINAGQKVPPKRSEVRPAFGEAGETKDFTPLCARPPRELPQDIGQGWPVSPPPRPRTGEARLRLLGERNM